MVLHSARRSACAALGLGKRVTVHTLRHSPISWRAVPIVIQVRLGHNSLSSTAR
jgi:integrase